MPQLDEFGDIDDLDVLGTNFTKLRRSYDNIGGRNKFKVRVADVANHRLERDPMNSSMGSQEFENTMDGGSPMLRGKQKKRGMRKQGTRDGSLEAQSPVRFNMTPDGQLVGPDGKVISSKGSGKNRTKPGSKASGKGGAAEVPQGAVVI